MNKLIGSLLVLSLIGRPSILRVDYIAYEVYKSSTTIINYLKREEFRKSEVDEDDIDIILDEIDTNKRYIDKLMQEKTSIVENLELLMSSKAKARIALDETQITQFQSFNKLYNDERSAVKESIEIINNCDLMKIQKEILHSEPDYEFIYAQLEDVSTSQNKIIAYLENFIMRGRQTMTLCY